MWKCVLVEYAIMMYEHKCVVAVLSKVTMVCKYNSLDVWFQAKQPGTLTISVALPPFDLLTHVWEYVLLSSKAP